MSTELTTFSTNIQMLRTRKGLSQAKLASALGVARTTISNWEQGIAFPLFEDLLKLAKQLDTTLNDMVNPLGPVVQIPAVEAIREIGDRITRFKGADRPEKGMPRGMPSSKKADGLVRFELHTPAGADGGNIVMLDSRAAAGWASNPGDVELLAAQPRFSLPGPQYRGEGVVAIELSGDSMEPTLQHGDWLIAKRLMAPLEELREGYVHLLLTRDGCVAKRLYRTPGEALLCKSDNEAYKPYKQPITEGDQVYRALAVLSENLGNRNEGLLHRMSAMEQAIMALQHPSKKR